MSEISFEEYRQLVENQGRALVDTIQSVALGDLDVEVKVLEGIEILSELALGVEMMIDHLQSVTAEHERVVVRMEAALARTEELYDGSERVVRAATLDGVLHALVHSTILRRLDYCNIQIFDHPWGDERPHAMTVVAAWSRAASSGAPTGGELLIPVGTRHVLEQFPATRWFNREEPLIVRDIATDEHIDERTRALFMDQLGMRSMIILPLIAGEQWTGILSAHSDAALDIDEAEIRQITSLVGQSAAMVQGLRLLEDARSRVRREQTLHKITTRARGFVDTETIMRTVVRELGAALGRPAFIRLGSAEELASRQAALGED